MVRLGTMGRIGGEAPADQTAPMDGHAASLVEDLHRAHTQTHIHDLEREGIRHTVEVPVHLHVVIDVGFRLSPLPLLVAACR